MKQTIEYLDTSRLEINKPYSYPELCRTLNQPIKKNKATRENQLEEFSRFFKYSVSNNKYIPKEIYKSPIYIEKKHSAQDIYTTYIERLLLQYLMKLEGHKASLSLAPLYQRMGAVNNKFSIYYKDKDKLIEDYNSINTNELDLIDYDTEYILDKCYSKLKEIIETALNRLKRQKDIQWDDIHELLIYNKKTNNYYTRIATSEERSLIIKVENDALRFCQCQTERQIRQQHKDRQYYNKCNELINKYSAEISEQENSDETIQKFWSAYLIIYNREIIPRALDTIELKLNQMCLNAEIINYLNKNTDENINSEHYIKRLGEAATDYLANMATESNEKEKLNHDINAVKALYKDVYNYLLQVSPDEFEVLKKEKRNAKRRQQYKEKKNK